MSDVEFLPAALEIERTPEGETLRLTVRGELDVATAADLMRELEARDSDGFERLVIDLSGVRFMDSSGLAVLIRAQQELEAKQRRLALRRGPGQVQRLFELAGIADRFTFED